MIGIDKLYEISKVSSEYYKNKSDEDINKLLNSTTLYVGNLSFYSEESKIFNHFSQCGIVKRIIMGLNKQTKLPCGFCFVEYYSRSEAQSAINILNHSKIDSRTIRVDWDIGFIEGRQYGRGFTGGQKRDEFNRNTDPDRPKASNNERYNNDKYENKGGYNKYHKYNKYHNDNDKYDKQSYLHKKRDKY